MFHRLSCILLPANIPMLVKAVVSRISTIYQLCAAKRAKLGSLFLPEGLYLLLDSIADFLFISGYSNLYANARGNIITKSMWREMKVDNYDLFYLTGFFAVHIFTETYVDNSTLCSEGSVHNYHPNSPPNESF